MLRQTACLSDALAIIEDAVRFNLLRPTPEDDEVDWLCLQAHVLVDAGHFAEAETVLRDAMKKQGSSDPDWHLTVVEYSILRQTGRVDQTLLLLENSTSSIAKGASDTIIYFLFSDLSSTQLDIGQIPNALETAEKALIKCRELHLYHPHKLQPWIAVAYALTTLSNCLAAVGRTDEGLRAAQEAAAIYARLPWRGFCPWGYRPQDFASKAYHTLSLHLAASGQAEEALLNAEKAVGEYRDLVSLAFLPTLSLASSLRNLASRLWDVGRQEHSAVGILRQLVTNQSYLLSALCDSLEQLAMYLSEKGDAVGSSVAASECAIIRERIGHSPVLTEGEADAESDSELCNAEEESGSSLKEFGFHGAPLAIEEQTETRQVFSQNGILPMKAEEIPPFPLDVSIPESETSPAAQQGVTTSLLAEALATEKSKEITDSVGAQLEVKNLPFNLVWWILVAIFSLLAYLPWRL
ncbi:hypothetical protein C8J57DRAFT_1295711 [Mycena rebaudengoi]|nr:hypothetical protein C8J57DRAFT_1295711 [Mycena rebaudengoi]